MPKHPGTDHSAYFPTGDRRFPPPWTAEVTPKYFIVRDANGQQLAPSMFITKATPVEDEARWIAVNIAKLPGLLRKA